MTDSYPVGTAVEFQIYGTSPWISGVIADTPGVKFRSAIYVATDAHGVVTVFPSSDRIRKVSS